MSKHGQNFNETRSYGEGFEDGRRYERMNEHRASLIDPDMVYHKPRTDWHKTPVTVVCMIAAAFLVYAVMSAVDVTNLLDSGCLTTMQPTQEPNGGNYNSEEQRATTDPIYYPPIR